MGVLTGQRESRSKSGTDVAAAAAAVVVYVLVPFRCAGAVDAVVSVSRPVVNIARRSGGAMTTRGEWARSRRCCNGIARSAP